MKRPRWYDYRISSFGNYMPTYWRRDHYHQGRDTGGRRRQDRQAGTSIVAYIAGAIGLFIAAGVLVAFL